MKELLVLPIVEDNYSIETNTLDMTMFISYKFINGEIEFLSPIDVTKEIDFKFNPIGFENFTPKNINHEQLINILQDMYINNLNYDNDFKIDGEVSTFKFNQLPDTLVAYPIYEPEDTYYISVLKMKYNLDSLDYSYDVFNIVEMNKLTMNNVIVYPDLDLNIDISKLNNEQSELHEIALKLQFASFNEKLYLELKEYGNMYLISQPHILKN